MFSKLWKQVARTEPSTPDDTIIYAVGDIHGRADLLRRLHADILEDSAARSETARKVVVYLGDYVDRGPYVREVIDILADSPLEGFEAVFLKGNHEAMLLDFLEDPTTGLQWRDNGGLETLKAYDATATTIDVSPMAYDAARDLMLKNMPASHRSFFRHLLLSASYGDYYFVHAGIRPGIDLEKQVERDQLWIRYDFLDSNRDFGKIVVHGHTPDKNIIVKSNRIGIDTGAFMTNVLTCLILDGEKQEFLQTD